MIRTILVFAIQLIAVFAAFIHPESAVGGVFIMWLSLIVYTAKGLDRNFPFFAFLISFFTFLLAGLVLERSSGIGNAMTARMIFQCQTLVVSLLFLFFGYFLSEKSSRSINGADSSSQGVAVLRKQEYYYAIRRISKGLVYFCSVFALIEVIEQISFFRSHSYIELYSDFRGSLPYLVYKFANLFSLSAYIYYSTLPSKDESKFVNILFVIIPLLYLFTGRRGIAILPLLLYITYCFIRNHITPSDKWIGRRGMLFITITFPFVCAFMFLMSQYRQGNSTGGMDAIAMINEFFLQTSSSVDIIGMTYDLRYQLPEKHVFLLGPIYDVIYGSGLNSLLGFGSFSRNTAEFAMSGKSLGSFLSYNFITTRYLEGAGVGSCYIAEAYADLGWIGIILINILYGIILYRIPKWFNRNLILSIASFFILFGLYKAPRAQAFGFAGDLIGPTNILIVIIIHLWATRRTKQI